MSDLHLTVVPHTHWDREWYRTHEDFRFRLVRLLDGLLDLLEADTGFRHFTLDGQTIVLDDYLAVRPGARGRIEKLVRSGRLVVGPWTVLPDEWLVSGEALIRNLRLGLAAAAEFGGGMKVGYVPDQFGHVGQLPQLFAGFGFEAAVLWRGVGADITDTTFQWEAPDGTRVFTLNLIRGYGNAVDLPLDPAALAGRLEREIAEQAPQLRIRSLLLMNGSDHREPQPGLPEALAAALSRLDGVEGEIGTLPGFAARARAEAPADLAVHRGELRSGLRSPLLAGCASSRMPQKRSDFLNDRILTRYLEPLAAWLGALGDEPDTERIAFAWRVALENHPHDSICGCSIDAVHDQMEMRFARVAEIAGGHLRQVTSELARRIALPAGIREPAVAVWNPSPGGVAQAEGEIEFDLPPGVRRAPVLHLRDASGRRLPVHCEVVEAAQAYADYTFPAPVVRAMLAGFPDEFFGKRVCGVRRRSRGGRHAVEVLMGETPPARFDFAAAKRDAAVALAALGDAPVAYRVRRLARLRLRFVDAFPGCGLRVYGIARGPADGPGDAPLRAERTPAGGALIENAAWRVEVGADGRVGWLDRRTGTATADALRLVSEGDRGDTYTFDPVRGAEVVERPTRARVALCAASDSEVGIALDLDYRVPIGLRADRAHRAARRVTLPVRLELRLLRALDRIDVRIEVDNTARDHRLRARVRAGFAAVGLEVESAFEVAERPIAPPPDAFGSDTPAELPSGASPQRSFATLRDGSRGLTLANRGCAEIAAVHESDGGTALALTLLRAVGDLSRGDLARRPVHAGPPIPTPGAQVPGRHTIEFSIRCHSRADPERTAAAHRYAFPPLAFAAQAGGGPLGDGARLLEVDEPAVVVSAIEPQPVGPPVFRIYNASAEERRIRLRHHLPGDSGHVRVDLRGRPLAEDAPPDADDDVRLRPWQIVSLRQR